MIKSNIGGNIKRYRLAAGMTQAELAGRIAVSRPTISSWEINRTEPSMNDIEFMANLFGCNKTDLLGDLVEKVSEQRKMTEIEMMYVNLPKDRREQVDAFIRFQYEEWKRGLSENVRATS